MKLHPDIDRVEDAMNALVSAVLEKRLGSTDESDPLEDLSQLCHVTEGLHGRTCQMAAAVIHKFNTSDDPKKRAEDARAFLEACVTDFAGNLRLNWDRNAADLGCPKLFDENAELREELLGALTNGD